MSKYLLSAAAAALMIAGNSAAWAADTCNLPGGDNTQWTCEGQVTGSTPVTIIVKNPGSSTQCKNGTATETTTTDVAVNPGGTTPGTDNFDGTSSTSLTAISTSGGAFPCPTDKPVYDQNGNLL